MLRRSFVAAVLALSCSSTMEGQPSKEVSEPELVAEQLTRPWARLYVPRAVEAPHVVRYPGGYLAVSREIVGGKVLSAVYNYLYRSNDGVRWERLPLEGVSPLFGFRGLSYGGGRFVMTGAGPGSNEIWSSTDLPTWSRVEPLADQWGLTHVMRVNERFFAFTTRQQIFTSTEGITWSRATIETGQVGSVAFGNGLYVMGGSGPLQISSDGKAWQSRPLDCALPGACISDPSGGINQGFHPNALFVAGQFFVDRLSSPDAEVWRAHADPPADAHVAGYFFAHTRGADPSSLAELRAWKASETPVTVSTADGPLLEPTISEGQAPSSIDLPLPGGQTCLTHRCVLVGQALYLIQ